MARTLLVGALACLALICRPAAGAQASSTKEYPLNIPRQPLTRALEQLYDQTGVYYGYSPELARRRADARRPAATASTRSTRR